VLCRWERELAPFVTGAAAPTWEMLAELPCETLPSRSPARQVAAAATQAPVSSTRESEGTGTPPPPPPPLLVMPDAEEVEALLMKEVEAAANSFPGRARSSVSGAPPSRLPTSLPSPTPLPPQR